MRVIFVSYWLTAAVALQVSSNLDNEEFAKLRSAKQLRTNVLVPETHGLESKERRVYAERTVLPTALQTRSPPENNNSSPKFKSPKAGSSNINASDRISKPPHHYYTRAQSKSNRKPGQELNVQIRKPKKPPSKRRDKKIDDATATGEVEVEGPGRATAFAATRGGRTTRLRQDQNAHLQVDDPNLVRVGANAHPGGNAGVSVDGHKAEMMITPHTGEGWIGLMSDNREEQYMAHPGETAYLRTPRTQNGATVTAELSGAGRISGKAETR